MTGAAVVTGDADDWAAVVTGAAVVAWEILLLRAPPMYFHPLLLSHLWALKVTVVGIKGKSVHLNPPAFLLLFARKTDEILRIGGIKREGNSIGSSIFP